MVGGDPLAIMCSDAAFSEAGPLPLGGSSSCPASAHAQAPWRPMRLSQGNSRRDNHPRSRAVSCIRFFFAFEPAMASANTPAGSVGNAGLENMAPL